jgi:hypothetical protein
MRPVVLAAALVVSAAAWPQFRVDLQSAPQAPARPRGWDARTHGDGATPDYARLFSLERVHELNIVISADNYRRMQEDLLEIVPWAQFMGRGRSGAPPAAGAPPPGGAAPPGSGILGRGWNLTTRDPEYVPVTVHHDGRVWTQVGMRFKGNFSLMMAALAPGNGKTSFRLNFDRYEDTHPEVSNQRFHGFKELTFSSNFGDDTQIREALANEIFRDRGVAAPRVAFYRISVDAGGGPEYWGLYTMVEDPADGAMLRSQFGRSSGNLYKPDGPGADWTKFDPAGFEKKNNRTKPDYTDVAEAIAALHADGPSAQWRANLEKRLDVDHFLRWLAVNQVVDNWDAYGRFAHNYYLYADPGRGGRLVWIPWDNNFAFGGTPFGAMPIGFRGAGPPPPAAPGQRGTPAGFMIGSSDDVLHERVGKEWPLISRLLADGTYRARYRAHLADALGGLYEADALRARAHAWHALIASAVARESEFRTTVSSQQSFQGSIDGPAGLLASIERRRSLIKAALAR